MNLRAVLNPLTKESTWIFAFVWQIMKGAALAVPTTVEVFLHHRFGVRSGGALVKGFLLLLAVGVMPPPEPHARIRLFPAFLVVYVIAVFGHWLTSLTRPQGGAVHSYSTGEPWPVWGGVSVETTTVERYLEPALCFLFGVTFWRIDLLLSYWAFLAGGALFIRGQVRRFQARTRQLDALDSRMETREMAPRVQDENETFVEARPAPPRTIRRPQAGQHPYA
jgi:hypothetical protein